MEFMKKFEKLVGKVISETNEHLNNPELYDDLTVIEYADKFYQGDLNELVLDMNEIVHNHKDFKLDLDDQKNVIDSNNHIIRLKDFIKVGEFENVNDNIIMNYFIKSIDLDRDQLATFYDKRAFKSDLIDSIAANSDVVEVTDADGDAREVELEVIKKRKRIMPSMKIKDLVELVNGLN